MSRLLLLVGLLIGLFATDAEACQRCGLFGNRCRFQSYYYPTYQPVTYAAQPTTQNFVFNNSYPVAALLGQGNTVYGYSLAAQPYTLDPAQVLDRAGRLAELAFTSGQKAVDDFNDTAGNALALSAEANRQQQNTLLAMTAIQANSQAQPTQSLSFRATVTNGKLSLERIEAAPSAAVTAPCPDGNCPPPAPKDGTLSLSAGNLIGQYCGTCHDGTGQKDTPRGFVLDGQTRLVNGQFQAAAKAVMAGKMPPKSQLSEDDRLAIVAELAKLDP